MITAITMSNSRHNSNNNNRGSQRGGLPSLSCGFLCGQGDPSQSLFSNAIKKSPKDTVNSIVLKWDTSKLEYSLPDSLGQPPLPTKLEVAKILDQLKLKHPYYWKCSLCPLHVAAICSILIMFAGVAAASVGVLILLAFMETAYKVLIIIVMVVTTIFLLNGCFAIKEFTSRLYFRKR